MTTESRVVSCDTSLALSPASSEFQESEMSKQKCAGESAFPDDWGLSMPMGGKLKSHHSYIPRIYLPMTQVMGSSYDPSDFGENFLTAANPTS